MEGPLLVDSMKLAYWVFIAFRSGRKPDLPLEILIDVLEAVERQGVLVVPMPDDTRSILEPVHLTAITAAEIAAPPNAHPQRLEDMQAEYRNLIPYIKVAAHEMKRLREAGLERALKSLGYAMHVVPEVISRQEKFDADLYKSNFRLAATNWSDFSAEMRAAMAKVVGIDLAGLDEVVQQEGFALDWY